MASLIAANPARATVPPQTIADLKTTSIPTPDPFSPAAHTATHAGPDHPVLLPTEFGGAVRHTVTGDERSNLFEISARLAKHTDAPQVPTGPATLSLPKVIGHPNAQNSVLQPPHGPERATDSIGATPPRMIGNPNAQNPDIQPPNAPEPAANPIGTATPPIAPTSVARVAAHSSPGFGASSPATPAVAFRLDPSASALRTIPSAKVLTPGGDRYGYAPVSRPYTRAGAQRLTGLLVSHDPTTGEDLTCGAAVIRSRRKNLVATAAHCVFANRDNQRHWLKRVAFIPAYNSAGDGTAPLGIWPAVRLWVPKRWRTQPYSFGLLPYDIAVVEVGKEGKLLEEVTGPGLIPRTKQRWKGTAEVDIYGYPADLHYSGGDMYRCHAQATNSGTPSEGLLLTTNCQIVNGGSGGPVVTSSTLVGIASSSGPYRDPVGFSLITTTAHTPFRSLLALAERAAPTRRPNR